MADDAAAPEGELTETTPEPDTTVEPTDADETALDTDEAEETADEFAAEDAAPPRTPWSHVKIALVAGLVGVLALAG